MKVFWLACMLAVITTSGAACGSDPIAPTASAPPAPPPPIPAATIVVSGGLSFPKCPQLTLGPLIGQPIASCPTFNGVLQNVGIGCAASIRGVVTISNGGGSAGWRYDAMVRPSELFAYSGGPITVPVFGDWTFTANPTWENVRCP